MPVIDPAVHLSVILPAYRAADVLARNVPALAAYLTALAFPFEIIVVDDGSRDGGRTRDVSRAMGCHLLELPRNAGKGAAVRAGMRAASGRYRIYTDADVPFEFSCIEMMLRYLDFKEFDIVAGDRTLPESRYFAELTKGRRIASAVCSTLVGRFIATGWFDTQCGIKGFRHHVADDLFGIARVNRFAFDVELFYIALKRNYDIKRIPVALRANDTSSVRLMRDGAVFAADLARIRWNQALGRYRPAAVVPPLDRTPSL